MKEQATLESMMLAFLGKKGVEMIGKEWKEFSPFDTQVIDLHGRALKCMRQGEIDLKTLLEINNDFDFYTETFLKQTKIRETKGGTPISYWDIFGGVAIPRPEYAAYEIAKLIMIVVAQKKIIKTLMEEQGEDMSVEKLTLVER